MPLPFIVDNLRQEALSLIDLRTQFIDAGWPHEGNCKRQIFVGTRIDITYVLKELKSWCTASRIGSDQPTCNSWIFSNSSGGMIASDDFSKATAPP